MSEWSGPGASPQQYPQREVESNGLQRLVNMVSDLRRDLREATSTLLSTAGIFISRTGMRVASSLTVSGDLVSTGNADIDGTLNVDAATTIGGTLGVTGATTLGAPTTITGTLTVSGSTDISGSLDVGGTATVTGNLQSSNYVAGVAGYRLTPTTIELNDLAIKAAAVPDAALAHIVKGDSKNASQTASVGAGTAVLAVATFTVPPDVSTVTVSAGSAIRIATGTTAAAFVSTHIGGTGGPIITVAIDPTDGEGNAASNYASTFAVSPGATFTISTYVSPNAAAVIEATTSATAIFYR